MSLNEVGEGSLVQNVDTGDDCCIPILSQWNWQEWRCQVPKVEKQTKLHFFIVLLRGRTDSWFSQHQHWQLQLYLALQPKVKFTVAIKHPSKMSVPK